MLKKLLKLAATVLLMAAPLAVQAQVFNQSQVIVTPYGGPGFVVSTTTGNAAKLSATSTPFFANFSFGNGTSTGNTYFMGITASRLL